MNPRIIVISRTDNSPVYELKDQRSFSVGRVQDNHLVLADKGISRHHFSVAKKKASYLIKDLESHNGTFVNGMPIGEQMLAHGDRIRAGRTDLLFLLEDEGPAGRPYKAVFDDENLVTLSEVQLSMEEAAANRRSDLTLLVKIGKAINEIKDPEELQKALLENILEITAADRGAIAVMTGSDDFPEVCCSLDRTSRANGGASFSRTVARRVLAGNMAVMSNNIAARDLRESESLVDSKVTSVLCVPLVLGGTNGLIYLDSSAANNKFSDDHLQQMTAIAAMVAAALENSRRFAALRLENENLQAMAGLKTAMIGDSPPIRSLLKTINKVAHSDSTVLILGESGTGKELAARTLHDNSGRAQKPFIALNCAALNDNLLESELFGHERGAFTGAFAPHKGMIEQAEGGTIFLDEIGELAFPLQAKLLRVLQEREFQRVGSTQTRQANIRVIAATNRNLKEEYLTGAFREDLYYRLNVVSINMPPLRNRREDIPLLVQHFIRRHAERCKRTVDGLAGDAKKALLAYDFPGNIRELENIVERAIVLGSSEKVELEDLPLDVVERIDLGEDQASGLYQKLKNAKKQIVLDALTEAEGNYTEAARRLGIHPNNLHRMIGSLGIKTTRKRSF